jgi:hypothetical protein
MRLTRNHILTVSCRCAPLTREFPILANSSFQQHHPTRTYRIPTTVRVSIHRWLKDKFGLSWQITQTILYELLSSPDREKSKRAMQAMMTMKKIDIEGIKRAAELK